MPHPTRLQLSRAAGFDLAALSHKTNGRSAVKVDRSTCWGNPYKLGQAPDERRIRSWIALSEAHPIPPALLPSTVPDAITAANLFRQMIAAADIDVARTIREHLAGKNLACWCGLEAPCHATVLLKLANGW